MDTVTGGQSVVEVLAGLGVRHVFGIVSVHNLPIFDAIQRDGRITLVPVRHEQGAVHAADGYARATGGLGVALTSTGPGAANAMGGLFEAAYASSRVLMVTGQIPTHYLGKGHGYMHEADRQLDMLRSVCRRAETVRTRGELPDVIGHVVADVLTGRPSPGAVEIPIDLQSAPGPARVPDPVVPPPQRPDPERIAEAWALLRAARRPLLWAGGGVNTAGAGDALVELAERIGAPVLTSTEGRGAIPEDHPLALGPNSEMEVMAPVIRDADVVLAVGTRFQSASTMQQAMRIPGLLVHLDADPGVIGRRHHARVGVVTDARLGLEALVELASHEAPDVDPAFVEAAREARRQVEAETRSAMGPDHDRVERAIRAALPRDALLVKDATIAAYVWANRLLPVYAPRTSIRPTSMAIGPGLPLAIGAAVGTGRQAVLIQGDGGLMLSVGELATLAEQRLPVVVCVFNDRGYGILRWMQDRMLDGRRLGVDLRTPDFAALARSVGVAAARVDDVEEFVATFEKAAHSGEPWLIDVDLGRLHPMEIRPQRPADK